MFKLFLHNKKKADILECAWELYQAGQTIEEIVKLYPQAADFLRSNLSLADKLQQQAKRTLPSKKLLSNTLSRLEINSVNVTTQPQSRYKYQLVAETAAPKGRFTVSNFSSYLINLLNFMTKKTYALTALTVLALAVVVSIGWYLRDSSRLANKNTSPLASEIDSFPQELAELNNLANSQQLADLDNDLAALISDDFKAPANNQAQPAGKTVNKDTTPPASVDTQAIENLDEELQADLDNLGNDLDDLGSFGNDSSLDDLDGSLSNLSS